MKFTFHKFTMTSTNKERGALYPQMLLTFTMSIGSLSFGHILNWGEPALVHMKDLTFVVKEFEHDYAWVTCAGPLATAVGIGIWSFLTKRMGPKNTLLLQAPFMLFSWFLLSYFHSYQNYYAAHFIGAFSCSSYLVAGEIYIIECVHRYNKKILFSLFRSSITLGILSMNLISTFLDKTWLCITGSIISICCFALTMSIPDSPRYLMSKSETEAENSLRYYLGKNSVGTELHILKQHIYFLNIGSYNNHMLYCKVILKAIMILFLLQFFKLCTGYYVFILDSVRIFQTGNIISPYGDNIIFGLVLYITKVISYFVHLYGNFGIKKPMMISMFLCSLFLCVLGIVNFFSTELNYVPMAGTELLILSAIAISYGIGLDVCPEIALYAYIPYQLYDFLNRYMAIMKWILIFVTARVYMECRVHWKLYLTFWTLTGLTMIGFIFITLFIIDTKGKSLMNIQMELGGNPVGTRGSWRQRISNPFESLEDMYYLEKLIAADLSKTANKLPSDSISN